MDFDPLSLYTPSPVEVTEEIVDIPSHSILETPISPEEEQQQTEVYDDDDDDDSHSQPN